MRSVPRRFMATFLLLLCSTRAWAQSGAKPLPAPQTGVEIPSHSLLRDPAIQHEIGLTEKQRNNLDLIDAEAEGARLETMAAGGEEGFDFNAMMSGVEDLSKQQRTATAKLLTTTQRGRLLQIEWQREGWPALGRSDVAAKLNLKPAQVQKVRAILESMRQKQSQAIFAVPDAVAKSQQKAMPKADLNPSNGFQGNSESLLPGGGPLNFNAEEFQAQTTRALESSQKALTESAREVEGILTAEQKAAFERLLGPPFDFKKLNSGFPVKLQNLPPKARSRTPKGSTKAK